MESTLVVRFRAFLLTLRVDPFGGLALVDDERLGLTRVRDPLLRKLVEIREEISR